jgi:hypothetical protein
MIDITQVKHATTNARRIGLGIGILQVSLEDAQRTPKPAHHTAGGS